MRLLEALAEAKPASGGGGHLRWPGMFEVCVRLIVRYNSLMMQQLERVGGGGSRWLGEGPRRPFEMAVISAKAVWTRAEVRLAACGVAGKGGPLPRPDEMTTFELR